VRLRRQAEAALLLLLGGTLLKLVLGGGYLRYVRPVMAPLLAAAGALLVLLGAATLWREFRRRDSGGGHHHGGAQVGWLLLIPVLVLLVAVPPGVGAYNAGRSGSALPTPAAGGYPALPNHDPVDLTLLDYADRAIYGHGTTLAGHQLWLAGFITTSGPGRSYLTRMVITCCAADARPVKIRLAGQIPANLTANTWIVATGRYNHHQDHAPSTTPHPLPRRHQLPPHPNTQAAVRITSTVRRPPWLGR
jgi:uncharacterized repeat protein (TIGR03943 family)